MISNILIFGIIILIAFTTTLVILAPIQSTFAIFIGNGADGRKAPLAITDNNIYVIWWTNKTPNNNEDVIFRASNDGGKTFGDKINLSNTANSGSADALINANGNTVAVTWWERNNTANVPVMRISHDSGATFGPLLQLSQNGTIGNSGNSGNSGD
jgi:hypothetical protein